ncbi:MAG: BamA/TamA family outer membrane protein [Opitutaceae bacterium]
MSRASCKPAPCRRRFLRIGGAIVLFLTILAPVGGSEPPSPTEEPAALSISGYGLIGNLRIKRTILALNEEGVAHPVFTASYLEDAALIILSRVGQDGFLKATVTAEIERTDGSVLKHGFSDEAFEPLPRPLRARSALFRIERGNRYYFDQISFDGLTRIPESEAIGFFRLTGLLYSSTKDRLYTPAILQRGLFSLAETLRRLGYREAAATASELKIDHETGGVSAVISVREGARTLIGSLEWSISSPENPPPQPPVVAMEAEQPYSDLWLQDEALALRQQFYGLGFADTKLDWRIESLTQEEGDREVQVVGEVFTGPVIRLNNVRFVGLERTHLGTVERRTGLLDGAVLNPLELEDARVRLRRLGAFKSVHYRQVPVDEVTRDVVFEMEEGKTMDVSLLFGYGSYEQFRGGIEMGNFNLFGRAHRSRLKLVQSMKSSNADYTYTVPELFGENLDGTFRAYGLRREEISFSRLETGVSAGVRRFVEAIRTDFALSYNFEYLGTEDSLLPPEETPDDVLAATIRLDLTHDRRDNPLAPTTGYRIYAETETSSRKIGANIDYQRFTFTASWHQPIRDGLRIHVGFRHGFAFTYRDDDDLPANKRFFPGGENSVRGYIEGEAAPRDATGVVIGAESSFVVNIELEQALNSQVSLIGFSDSTFNAASISDYPATESLYSIGLGLRYNTVIGPVRLEYGYNLNPRPLDPGGTLHFSIGFPF